jgi:hypothetical protein
MTSSTEASESLEWHAMRRKSALNSSNAIDAKPMDTRHVRARNPKTLQHAQDAQATTQLAPTTASATAARPNARTSVCVNISSSRAPIARELTRHSTRVAPLVREKWPNSLHTPTSTHHTSYQATKTHVIRHPNNLPNE